MWCELLERIPCKNNFKSSSSVNMMILKFYSHNWCLKIFIHSCAPIWSFTFSRKMVQFVEISQCVSKVLSRRLGKQKNLCLLCLLSGDSLCYLSPLILIIYHLTRENCPFQWLLSLTSSSLASLSSSFWFITQLGEVCFQAILSFLNDTCYNFPVPGDLEMSLLLYI